MGSSWNLLLRSGAIVESTGKFQSFFHFSVCKVFRVKVLSDANLFTQIHTHTHTHTHIYIYIYIYITLIKDSYQMCTKENSFKSTIIIIIIMSCRQHGYPWPSLTTSPYYSSPLAGLQGYILCPHIAAVCKFELVVLLLLGHMWGSIGVHHLWARPCFSRSVLRVWFV